MSYQRVIVWVIDSFLCLIMLGGIGAGYFLITRKQKIPGILGLVGFFLLGISALIKVLVYDIFIRQLAMTKNFAVIQMTANCVQGLSMFLGVGAIIAAFVIIARSPVSQK